MINDVGDNVMDDSAHTIAKIQNDCSNLSKLTTSLSSTNLIALKLDAVDSPKIVETFCAT